MIYTMPSEAAGREILEALASRYPIKHDDQGLEWFVVYDTFDWRLHKAGGFITLRRLPCDPPEGRPPEWPLADDHQLEFREVPPFAWDFPAGVFRDRLAPIIEMRRLLPRVEVEHHSRVVHMMDDEQKTVVRAVLRESSARRPEEDAKHPLPVTLRTLPLRGYDREHRELVRVLEDELGLVTSEHDEWAVAFAAVGLKPGGYSSKPQLRLDPAQRSDEAAANIFSVLLDTLQKNEDGTWQDLDSEFLHDFRVSVRRTRSALSQLKQVFPAQVSEHFSAEFKWLGGVTGPTRDLDVYLLKIDGYEASLPESVRSDLEPLRDFLKRHQRIEQQRLVGELDSARYRELIRSWSQFLSEPVKSSAANADRPIRDLAGERIWRAYRKVWKRGRAIGPETPAQALHDLRINCKKLRYLLEFFRSLYPAARVEVLIKALKQLQDNLGDFNDLEVQQDALRLFARQMQEEGSVQAETFLAMGELVAGLRRLQGEQRVAFAKRFARFSAPEHRRSFRKLFATRQ